MAKRKQPAQETKAAPAPAPANGKGKGKGKGKAKESAPPAKQPATKRARFEGPASPAVKAVAPKAKKGKSEGKKPVAATTPAAPITFVVSAGSYERLLYGISCTFVPSTSKDSGLPYELDFNPIFSFPAHLSSLRSVAASVLPSAATGSERKVGGKYLVSGGMDEVVKVWDLKRKKEVGTLDGDAAGTITCLRFVAQRNMLMAATTDSAITLYRVRDWVMLRSLKGHKGRVNSIDAHPAGRVALSVGQDKMLRMWDLVAGKAVATMKIGEEGDVVRWNTDGTKFAIITNQTLVVYSVDMTVLRSLTARSRFHDVRFCYFPLDAADPTQREYLFVACDDGKTRVFDLSTKSAEVDVVEGETGPSMDAVALLTGHANRVKMLDLLEVAYPVAAANPNSAPTAPSTLVLSSISTDGKINLYDLASLSVLTNTEAGEPVEIGPIASHDTDGSRLTCVCAIGLVVPKNAADASGLDGENDDGESAESESGDGSEDEEEIAFESEDEEEVAFESEDEVEYEDE
ncbi:protein MAK11, partial [Phenoliferia sp. Uapishka_3]